jgi:hypothetical protein
VCAVGKLRSWLYRVAASCGCVVWLRRVKTAIDYCVVCAVGKLRSWLYRVAMRRAATDVCARLWSVALRSEAHGSRSCDPWLQRLRKVAIGCCFVCLEQTAVVDGCLCRVARQAQRLFRVACKTATNGGIVRLGAIYDCVA